MLLTLLKAKLHQACVTHAELNYDGSCAIDGRLLDAAGILQFEQIDIYNINNGERFSTYAIPAPPGSGVISLNGAAARKAQVGDLLIICTFAPFADDEARSHKPKIVLLDAANTIKEIRKL